MTGSPLSLRVRLDNVPKAGRHIEIDASGEQRAALAAGHDLLEVVSFHADVSVRLWKRDGFRLEGNVRAEAIQKCVVTLDPVPARIDVPVDLMLVPEGSALDSTAGREEFLFHADSAEEPETFSGNSYDVGALCEELFALALDPYPRSPGARLAEKEPDGDDDTGRISPFAQLARRVRDQ